MLAHQERAARYRLAHVETTRTAAATAWRLSGRKSVVPAGDAGRRVHRAGARQRRRRRPAGIGLFLVERRAPGVEVRAATDPGRRQRRRPGR